MVARLASPKINRANCHPSHLSFGFARRACCACFKGSFRGSLWRVHGAGAIVFGSEFAWRAASYSISEIHAPAHVRVGRGQFNSHCGWHFNGHHVVAHWIRGNIGAAHNRRRG